ncbi:hypothetical protein P0D91_05215 [Pseudomonas sp. CBSPBW29]|uniref:hypothetical protein n=1 Tax=Pseudomonas TaxID=286 RepID=UPI0021AD2D6A|nr:MULTISPECIES: hypothetical protein [unclassified Pseudomonas]WEL43701.1 hypothetical protein P0D91_05215 [Pseudomonas sp. CBSPBW29]WEL64771.1 hypothetical protein P0D93_32765 [Pseudomonas sp. CBSPGW29]WEL68238.1 hypothetical protein P0D94_18670 [Pseudomonas sp. CBSPCGW29]WEL75259.1 hypothetical protein P0D92_24725 [Pseudomonas sp. CBSPAW29]WEL80497.1 hypothetical protein P0D95_21075 [Pseudomonas sp. CBSPCAW29]WEL89010.1 hypothetical protein P0D90_03340 [Pseudomonas sp. CBSPCBW29]
MTEQPFDRTTFDDFELNGWVKRISDEDLKIVHRGGNYYLESSAGYSAFIFIDKSFVFEPHTQYVFRFDFRCAHRVAASLAFWNGPVFMSDTLDAAPYWAKMTVPFNTTERPDHSMMFILRWAEPTDGPPISVDNLEIYRIPPHSGAVDHVLAGGTGTE